MTLVFKISLESGNLYRREKKKETILSIILKFLILVFYCYFMWLCSSIFFPLNFILIYILLFIQIDYFSLVNFILNLGK
jgi:hypothetical protein